MSAFTIRPAEFPRDTPAALAFIFGLQEFEYTVEKNRRLDDTVAGEHFAKLQSEFAKKPHAVFIADAPDGTALGWAVVVEQQMDIYVVAPERRVAYLQELYLVEGARGTGVGRALMGACEDWARSRAIPVMHIGVVAGNNRAHDVYVAAGFRDYAVDLRKYL